MSNYKISKAEAKKLVAASVGTPLHDHYLVKELTNFYKLESVEVEDRYSVGSIEAWKAPSHDDEGNIEELIGIGLNNEEGDSESDRYFTREQAYALAVGIIKLIPGGGAGEVACPAGERPSTAIQVMPVPSEATYSLEDFHRDIDVIQNDYPKDNVSSIRLRNYYAIHAVLRHEFLNSDLSGLRQYIFAKYPAVFSSPVQKPTSHE